MFFFLFKNLIEVAGKSQALSPELISSPFLSSQTNFDFNQISINKNLLWKNKENSFFWVSKIVRFWAFTRKAEWAVLDQRRPKETVSLFLLFFFFWFFLFGCWENRRESWKLEKQWQHVWFIWAQENFWVKPVKWYIKLVKFLILPKQLKGFRLNFFFSFKFLFQFIRLKFLT